MEINITWNICRICLQEERKNVSETETSNEPQMRNIFEENKKLAKYIYEFTGIFMKPNDSLPDKICLKCLKMINNAVQFRKTCRNSNAYLLNILERTQKASSLFKPASIVESLDDNELEEKEEEENLIVESKDWDEINVEQSKFEKQLKKKDVIENKEGLDEDVHKEQELNDSIEELDEIIEHFEDSSPTTEVTCTETIEETTEDSIPHKKQCKEQNLRSCHNDQDQIKPQTSQLQKFLMNAKFTPSANTEEEEIVDINEEMVTIKEKANHEELYYLIKDIDNENSNDSLKDLDEEQIIEADADDIEIYEIEEPTEENSVGDLMLHLEKENCEDNQEQVTSTVDTNDEIVYSEENSQESNVTKDLDDVYVISDNNSSQESRLSENINKNRKSPTIISKTNAKRKSAIKRSSPTKDEHAPNVCEICGNQFNNRTMLKLHMKIHYQQKNHQCEICLKSFITACNLQAHMRIHTGEKPFQCKYCDRRFSDRTSHIRHERTHTNEKPFKCPDCDKTFTLSTTLQNHIKVHTNERSYRCEPCGKSFKLSHHLKTHQNTSLHRSVMLIGSKDS